MAPRDTKIKTIIEGELRWSLNDLHAQTLHIQSSLWPLLAEWWNMPVRAPGVPTCASHPRTRNKNGIVPGDRFSMSLPNWCYENHEETRKNPAMFGDVYIQIKGNQHRNIACGPTSDNRSKIICRFCACRSTIIHLSIDIDLLLSSPLFVASETLQWSQGLQDLGHLWWPVQPCQAFAAKLHSATQTLQSRLQQLTLLGHLWERTQRYMVVASEFGRPLGNSRDTQETLVSSKLHS